MKLKDAIELAKKVAKKRDNNICWRCGEPSSGFFCHGSHIIAVGRSKRMAMDPDNIMTHCWLCHKWWTDNPKAGLEWLEENYPGYLDKLTIKNRAVRPIKQFEIDERCKELQSKITEHPPAIGGGI